MSKRIDLLNGGILSSLTRLALPIMATSLIQMAYNLTDMIWIGRIGSDAVASVGAASMFAWLTNALAVLARMGGQVKVAHALGADNISDASEYAKASLQIGIFFSIILSIIMIAFTTPLISFFKLNSQTVIADAEVYLKIVGGGLAVSIVNQIMTGLLTATGNSKTPFIATTIGLAVNIILDPILIFGFGFIPAFGVAGAAWATVTAQAIVTAMFILYCIKDAHLFHSIKLFTLPRASYAADIVKIGLPTAVQSMIFTSISMIIARLIAGWGDAAVAVQKVGSQIESISWMTADGFAVAINSFIAQNYGAKRFTRARKGFKTSILLISAWGVACTLFLILLAGPIFKIFIQDEMVVPMGIDYLVILGYSQLFMCIHIITAGAFSGYGKTLPPSIISIALTTLRIPVAIWLVSTPLGLNGVWWSITICTIMHGIVLITMFLIFAHGQRKKEDYQICMNTKQ